ncbi:DUF3465 domain-containing protein [Salinicola aestuarinus]|uniref:DUF3465 domain-containing protein n=1 Tax=Salinicola aestuarinus TaxID=1949082 RepID=UPI001FD95D76|nr:DUF3465 domain-containing protein [Salinicola aestuarinus]
MKARRRKGCMHSRLSTLAAALGLAGLVSVLIFALGGLLPDDRTPQVSAEETLRKAYESQRSDFWVEAQGEIVAVLADDRRGSRHQRMILRLASGQTLLVAHNIDIAPRLEGIEAGDALRVRGAYVWNAKGGILHWTHRDPDGRQPGGWLEWRGRRYR